jgi:hypothetical protein
MPFAAAANFDFELAPHYQLSRAHPATRTPRHAPPSAMPPKLSVDDRHEPFRANFPRPARSVSQISETP